MSNPSAFKPGTVTSFYKFDFDKSGRENTMLVHRSLTYPRGSRSSEPVWVRCRLFNPEKGEIASE
ncbi:hypothetical protein [Fibrivirga algicola]|uniref:Uncharacterized protein n=1 Tax=Fibrivirga algicola TaxID=2950420 RepID=A0ABX0QA03_9BACT|nr:hypothetical protein [Fibrivirga algicola]NID09025.1 hypothetical protein [Fibrivirga algicola]